MGRIHPVRVLRGLFAAIALIASWLSATTALGRELPVEVHIYLDRTGYFGQAPGTINVGKLGTLSLNTIAELAARLRESDQVQIHMLGGDAQQRERNPELASRKFTLNADRESLVRHITTKRTVGDFTHTDLKAVFRQIAKDLAPAQQAPKVTTPLRVFIIFSDFVNLTEPKYDRGVAAAISLRVAMDLMADGKSADFLKEALQVGNRRMNGLVIAYQIEPPPAANGLYRDPKDNEHFHQEIRRAEELATALQNNVGALPLPLPLDRSGAALAEDIMKYINSLRQLGDSTTEIHDAKIQIDDATGKYLISAKASNQQGATARIMSMRIYRDQDQALEALDVPAVDIAQGPERKDIGPVELPPGQVARLWSAQKIEVALADRNKPLPGRRQVELPAIPALQLDSRDVQIRSVRDSAAAPETFRVDLQVRNPFAGARAMPELRVRRQTNTAAAPAIRPTDSAILLEPSRDRSRTLTYQLDAAVVLAAAAAGETELQAELLDQPATAPPGPPQLLTLRLRAGPAPTPSQAECKVVSDAVECVITIDNPTDYTIRAARAVMFSELNATGEGLAKSADVAAADGQVPARQQRPITFRFSITTTAAAKLMESPRVWLEVQNADNAPLLKRTGTDDRRVEVPVKNIPGLKLVVRPLTLDAQTLSAANRVTLAVSREDTTGVFARVPIKITHLVVRQAGTGSTLVQLTRGSLDRELTGANAEARDGAIELAANVSSRTFSFDPSILRADGPATGLYLIALSTPWTDPAQLTFSTVPLTPRMLNIEHAFAYYMPFTNPPEAQIGVQLKRREKIDPFNVSITVRNQRDLLPIKDGMTNAQTIPLGVPATALDGTPTYIISAADTKARAEIDKEGFKNVLLSSDVTIVARYRAVDDSEPFELQLVSRIREPMLITGVPLYNLADYVGKALFGLIAGAFALFIGRRSSHALRALVSRRDIEETIRRADSALGAIGTSAADLVFRILSIGIPVVTAVVGPSATSIKLMSIKFVPPLLAVLGLVSLVYMLQERRLWRWLFGDQEAKIKTRRAALRDAYQTGGFQNRSIVMQALARFGQVLSRIGKWSLCIAGAVALFHFATGDDPFWRPWLTFFLEFFR